MSQKRYFYSGPHSAVTLKVPAANGALVDKEVILWSRREVELPADHEFTAALTQQGLLEPVRAEKAVATAAATSRNKSSAE